MAVFFWDLPPAPALQNRAWTQTLFDVLSPKDHSFVWVLEKPRKLCIPFFGQRYVEIAHDFASGVTEMEHHNHRGIPYGILKGDCLLITEKKTKTTSHITRKGTRNEEIIQVWKWHTFTQNWLKDLLALKNGICHCCFCFFVYNLLDSLLRSKTATRVTAFEFSQGQDSNPKSLRVASASSPLWMMCCKGSAPGGPKCAARCSTVDSSESSSPRPEARRHGALLRETRRRYKILSKAWNPYSYMRYV